MMLSRAFLKLNVYLHSFGSFNCSCPDGMQLNDDSQTCQDIDECELDSPCSHICKNIERRLVSNFGAFSRNFLTFGFTAMCANVRRASSWTMTI